MDEEINRFECIVWYEGDHIPHDDIRRELEKVIPSLIKGQYGTWVVPLDDLQDNAPYLRSECKEFYVHDSTVKETEQ